MIDDDNLRFHIHLINDPIVTDSNAILVFRLMKLAGPSRKWIVGQRAHRLNDSAYGQVCSWLIPLVCLVYFVDLVYLVNFVGLVRRYLTNPEMIIAVFSGCSRRGAAIQS